MNPRTALLGMQDGFTVLGAVAELERSLIVERVKVGLRNAKAKGKRLGRPRKVLNAERIAALRAQGIGWKRIAAQMGVGVGTIHRTSRDAVPLLAVQNSGQGF